MKKKPRSSPSVPFYSSEPAVSRAKIASRAPVPANLASRPPKTVDRNPGKLSGVAGFVDKGRPRTGNPKISVPKLGTKMKFPQQGKKSK